MLIIYSNNRSIETYSTDYVPKDFNPKSFDLQTPHTMSEWQCYFFASNPESKMVDKIKNCVYRTNAHSSAFIEYLKKKRARGLLVETSL